MTCALGFIALTAAIISGQNAEDSWSTVAWGNTFFSYFEGGQVGLTILSVSGVVGIALLRHKPSNNLFAYILIIPVIGPIAAASVMIGMNPGFQTGGLSETLLSWLWWAFFAIHAVWFFLLLLEPVVPSQREANEAQENRVDAIKQGAAGRE